MNTTVANAIKRTLLGIGHYAHRLRRDAFPGVAVLGYHGVREDGWPGGVMAFENLHVRVSELEAHCRLIRESCHPISLAQWQAALAGGPPLPSRPVLLTFDDGYRTVFTLARPVLERYAIPAVVFVCSEPVEQQELFWFDAVARARGEAEVERVKSLPCEEWEALRGAFSRLVDETDPHAPLTVAEVKALADVPGIEIGGHTATHVILARADGARQRREITKNKAALEAWIGRPVTTFAYPNGRPAQDYTADSVRLVRESGYDFGFTTRSRFASPQEPPLERSRFLMLAGISAAELTHRLAYSWRR